MFVVVELKGQRPLGSDQRLSLTLASSIIHGHLREASSPSGTVHWEKVFSVTKDKLSTEKSLCIYIQNRCEIFLPFCQNVLNTHVQEASVGSAAAPVLRRSLWRLLKLKRQLTEDPPFPKGHEGDASVEKMCPELGTQG